MVSRMLADFKAGTNRFDLPSEVLLAHVRDGAVLAVCGLNREQEITFGKGGRIRRLYVLPAHRGEGLARSLVEAIASFACHYHEVLTVNAGPSPAHAFYEHIGFEPVSHPSITHIKKLATSGRSGIVH